MRFSCFASNSTGKDYRAYIVGEVRHDAVCQCLNRDVALLRSPKRMAASGSVSF